MAMLADKRGLPVTRDQLRSVCETLGYDPVDVRSVYFRGGGPVVVEVFLRMPTAGTERGLRFQETPGGEYARARITHDVRSSVADDEETS